MAFNSYNNNQNRPTVNTFTPISFTNPNSQIMDTRLSISYFNRLMCITIAARTNPGSKDFPTYDTDNPVSIYISYSKAKILHDAIEAMEANPSEIHNVSVELKNGLLLISNGVEFGSQNPCVAIFYAKEDTSVNQIIYETKADPYYAAYNYSDGQYSSMTFPKHELDVFKMILEQYYLASSYAIAAMSREANMYNSKYIVETLKGIAGKVGYQPSNSGGSGGSFNNKSFLNGNNSGNGGGNKINGDVPNEYKQSTFSDIANSLLD